MVKLVKCCSHSSVFKCSPRVFSTMRESSFLMLKIKYKYRKHVSIVVLHLTVTLSIPSGIPVIIALNSSSVLLKCNISRLFCKLSTSVEVSMATDESLALIDFLKYGEKKSILYINNNCYCY